MDPRPAFEIAAGTFVTVEAAGGRSLCLKAERVGKEHVNHFLVPLEPLDEPTALSLRYIDPELALVPVDGVGLAFADGPARTEPDVGDIFANRLGLFLKIRDDAHSQRLFAYVDVRSGLIRARMERGIERLLRWRVQRF